MECEKFVSKNYFPYTIDEYVAIVTMSRAPVNGLDFEFLKQMAKVSSQLNSDDSVRVVLITSKFKVFGAGLDLKVASQMDRDDWHNYCIALHHGFNELENINKPVIGVVNGAAMGGGFLIALSCDFRMVGEKKGYFALTEANLGIPYLAGSTTRLPELVGKAKATELMFTGARISAQEALEMGFVNRVFRDEDLFEKSLEFAKDLSRKGKYSIAAAKKCLNDNTRRNIEIKYGLEHDAVDLTVETNEINEGYKSYFEKRLPNFHRL